tara:strand:+ start:871 stop:2004 length:1134 start_codon:yes stop_codon:yes gene_type:complete
MSIRRVFILGGYGNFGKRIAENLSKIKGITLFIAGRNLNKAESLCSELSFKGAIAELKPAEIDMNSIEFLNKLQSFSPELVIHTGGPFQRQDYKVPEACLTIGSHYIDLADDRRFVCDITSLNKQAKDIGVLIVSGASSVPGLSSAVIDGFSDQFSSLDEIDFAIAPGNKAERGEATVRGILSYTGHPFKVLSAGQWLNTFGWMDVRRLDFGKAIGKRWLADIDVPDLELFHSRYKGVKTVKFQAGLELPFLHWGMVFMALLTRIGLVKNWARFTGIIYKSSEIFKGLGTNSGGMLINITGKDKQQQPKQIKWTLCADNGVGPYIPTISAIILAKKLINGSIDAKGAMPCLGMYTLKEFNTETATMGIYHKTEINCG